MNETPPPASGPERDDLTIVRWLAVVLGHRRLVVLMPLGLMVLVVGVLLLLPRTYTSTAAFTPQGDNTGISRLAGLAVQFGMTSLGEVSNESPDFYAALLQSPDLLAKTVTTTYALSQDGRDTVQGDLVVLWHHGDEPRAVGIEDAVEDLQDAITVSTGTETGIVTLTVTAESPNLAQAIASRMIELVNEFNLKARQSQAGAEHRFTEQRLVAVGRALQVAEDSLRDFLTRNRTYTTSPSLMFEHDRLQRRVDLEQQLYTSLSQANEQAKIQQVRNTPVITVVDPGTHPAKPDHRRLVLKGLLALFVGAILALGWAFTVESVHGARADASHDPDLTRLWDESKADLHRLRGLLPRLIRRRR